MTIIFRALDAPFRVVAPFPSEPAYTERRSALPELTIDGDHRAAFLRRLGLDAGSSGRIAVDEMDSLLGRLTAIIDTGGADGTDGCAGPTGADQPQSSHLSRNGRVLTLDHGAPFIASHLTGQRQRRYFQGLVELLRQARHGLHAVTWSGQASK